MEKRVYTGTGLQTSNPAASGGNDGLMARLAVVSVQLSI
jgi:hypothetical protein